MLSRLRLLAVGNEKLGSIWTWSIPAVLTCPGSSALCRSLCYATAGFYKTSDVIVRMFKNLSVCASPFFIAWMLLSIRIQRPRVVRIHVSGDFYSKSYIAAWLYIVRHCRDVQFFTYTRSWRIPEMRTALAQLSKQPNVQLWYSCDAETGIPTLTKDERFVRRAYMAVRLDDVPSKSVDLIFRDYAVRGVVQKHVCGDLVCPAENGTGANIKCDKCQICYSDPVANKNKRTKGRFANAGPFHRPRKRIALPVVQ